MRKYGLKEINYGIRGLSKTNNNHSSMVRLLSGFLLTNSSD
jgi:hypothetical protein